MSNKEIYSGKVFYNWTVEYHKERDLFSRDDFWMCLCTCGTKKFVSARSLLREKSKSCGCLRGQPRPEIEKNCKYCKEKFKTKLQDSIYCSKKCFSNDQKQKAKELHETRINKVVIINPENIKRELILVSGQVFNRLTVKFIKFEKITYKKGGSKSRVERFWTCECTCGKEVTIEERNLIKGHTKKLWLHCSRKERKMAESARKARKFLKPLRNSGAGRKREDVTESEIREI